MHNQTTDRRAILRFRKVKEDTYEVLFGTESIGRVTKTWHRNGGNGWSAPGLNRQLGKTREEAARKIAKAVHVNPTQSP